MRVELLMIDYQNDFCDPNGALSVKGADKDCERVAKMIGRIGDKIDDIHATLDTHHLLSIFHPMWWKDSKGKSPNPFTIISVDDVKNGVWSPINPAWYKRSLEYVEQLQKNGRYPLCVWNPHCLVGSWGFGLYECVYGALTNWEKEYTAMVDYITKGSNIWTEFYSVVGADVPDSSDPTTQLNVGLIQTLEQVDMALFLGEAKSHCCKFSFTDIINNFGKDSIKKVFIAEDAMSSVPGFEVQGDEFLQEMIKLGANITTTDKFLK